MPVERRKPRSPSGRVSPRLYLIVGALLIALPLLGYFVSNWYVTKKKWAEECFRKPLWRIEGEGYRILSAAISPDGRLLLAGGTNGVMELRELATGRKVRDFEKVPHEPDQPEHSCHSVVFSQDGKTILSVGGIESEEYFPPGSSTIFYGLNPSIFRRWDAGSGKLIEDLSGGRGISHSILSHDGSRAVATGYKKLTGNKKLFVCDIASGRDRVIPGTGANITAFAVSPDGRRALTGGQKGSLVLWDLEHVKEERRLAGHEAEISAVAFSPDGRRALSGERFTWMVTSARIFLWDLERGEIRWRLQKQDFWVFPGAVAFSPDGRRAVIGGRSDYKKDVLRLMDLESGEVIRSIELPERKIGNGRWNFRLRGLAFSPDGRYLVAGGGWVDAEGEVHSELFAWRLPDEFGYWLLGTKEAAPAGPRGAGDGGGTTDSRYPSR